MPIGEHTRHDNIARNINYNNSGFVVAEYLNNDYYCTQMFLIYMIYSCSLKQI